MIERLPELVNGDAALVRRGRWFTDVFMVEIGDAQYLVHVREGRIETVERGPFVMRSWQFALRASAEIWQLFWQQPPKPGYHDIFALLRKGEIVFDGDLQPMMANLLYIKAVIAAPRMLAAVEPGEPS
jgi:hypothetical protein